MLFCLYNHSQQLEGKADGTSTYPRNPLKRKETNIKREWNQEKLLGSCQEPILSGKLSPSQLDREEHRVNHCPYTKA